MKQTAKKMISLLTGPIVYPMALVKAAKHPEAAGKFVAFLKSAEAAKVFARYQFIPLMGKR